MPFGPEVSWPYGFRQLDPDSRDALESAYGTGPQSQQAQYQQTPQHPQTQYQQTQYQQPAMEDYGYGDPGYSDPSYEGPRTGPAFGGQPGNAAAPGPLGESGYRSPDTELPGYHVPEIRESSRPGYGGPGYGGPGYQPQELAPPSGGQQIWPVTGARVRPSMACPQAASRFR